MMVAGEQWKKLSEEEKREFKDKHRTTLDNYKKLA
jgi:hypothetical protein